MIEDNDDDVQNALYWRQAVDVRTFELSVGAPFVSTSVWVGEPANIFPEQSVEIVCKCGNPANPDKTLIGCANETCKKWLHDECLKHEALMKTFERLGRTKPHIKDKSKDPKTPEEAARPLSPTETGAAVSARHSIDVRANGDGGRSVDVRSLDEDEGRAGSYEGRSTPSGGGGARAANNDSPGTPLDRRGPGRPRKKRVAGDGIFDSKAARPYEGLFDATVRMDLTPNMMEFRDLRVGVEGGEKKWMEPIHCLICGSQIQ